MSIHCEPKLDGHSGFPLGLTLDNDDTLLVADVRLGILRVQPNGSYQLVRMILIYKLNMNYINYTIIF